MRLTVMLQKASRWALTRLLEPREIGGLRLYDLRRVPDDRPASIVEGAWERLSEGDRVFRDVVLEHLPIVVVSTRRDATFYGAGVYYSRFRALEGSSPLFFASQLVWMSEWIRIWKQTGRDDDDFVKRICAVRRFAFIDSVGRPEEWVEPMRARVLG